MKLAKLAAPFVISALTLALVAAPSSADPSAEHGNGNGHRPPPVTNIHFKLDDHEVAVGDTMTGTVMVATHAHPHWMPFAAASLSLRVDGTEVAVLLTDDTGHAAITYVPAVQGGHVMRVVFLGDDLHKRAQRAQGFEASAAPDPVIDPSPEPSPETSPEPSPVESPAV